MERKVFITGAGVISALGDSPAELHAALCNGRNGVYAAAIARSIRLALNNAHIAPEEIDCLSASANGSVLWDRYEAQSVAVALNGRAQNLPVTAIKSMLGETLGASGAMQVIALLEVMREGTLPGIRQLKQIEENFPLAMASPQSRRVDLRHALINSIGWEGNCCSLVLARGDKS